MKAILYYLLSTYFIHDVLSLIKNLTLIFFFYLETYLIYLLSKFILNKFYMTDIKKQGTGKVWERFFSPHQREPVCAGAMCGYAAFDLHVGGLLDQCVEGPYN